MAFSRFGVPANREPNVSVNWRSSAHVRPLYGPRTTYCSTRWTTGRYAAISARSGWTSWHWSSDGDETKAGDGDGWPEAGGIDDASKHHSETAVKPGRLGHGMSRPGATESPMFRSEIITRAGTVKWPSRKIKRNRENVRRPITATAVTRRMFVTVTKPCVINKR